MLILITRDIHIHMSACVGGWGRKVQIVVVSLAPNATCKVIDQVLKKTRQNQ